MLSVYNLKPGFQKKLTPVCNYLFQKGVTANQITIASIFLSALIGGLFLLHPDHRFTLLIVPLGLLLRMALNAIDGMIARRYDMQSRLGEVLNEAGDVISDLMIIFPLIIIPQIHSYVIIVFAVLAMLNEYAGILGKALGGERRYEGPMGKSDRALLISIFSIFLFFLPHLAVAGNWIFSIASLLLLLSTWIRLKKSVEEAK